MFFIKQNAFGVHWCLQNDNIPHNKQGDNRPIA